MNKPGVCRIFFASVLTVLLLTLSACGNFMKDKIPRQQDFDARARGASERQEKAIADAQFEAAAASAAEKNDQETEYLSETKSGNDAAHASSFPSPLVSAIDKSDDSHQYRSKFLLAAWELISQQRCTIADFEYMGGWVRSTTHGRSVYFTYCGGLHVNNRIYLNVISGRIFRQ